MPKAHRVVVEVTVVFSVVLGLCKVLDGLRDVPWIARHDVVALGAAALFLYVPLIMLKATGARPEEFGITSRGLGTSIWTAVGLAALFVPAFLLLYGAYRTLWLGAPLRLAFPSGWPLLLAYHLFCVALPEEVFYRGYVQSRLNGAMPRRIRLFSTALGFGWFYAAFLFALGHFIMVHRLERWATFLPGLVFGWMRERTGGIAAPTVFHALCNGAVLFVT